MARTLDRIGRKLLRFERGATKFIAIKSKLAAEVDDRFLPYADKPAQFINDILGVHLVPRQIEAAELILKPPYRILIPSGNELGKTLLCACIVLWWFCTRRPAIIITTAPKFDQVKKLLWKEIRRLAKRAKLDLPFQPKACHIERAEDDFVTGTTARDSTGFQGHHGPSQLFIFDEATGVEADFWEATESMFSPPGHAWVCIFNPTDTSSRAYLEYSSAVRDRRNGEAASWHVVRMSALDHPNIAAELRGEAPPVPHAIRLGKFERLLKAWSQLVADGAGDVGDRAAAGATAGLRAGEEDGSADESAISEAHQATDVLWPPAWAKDYCRRTNQRPRWYRPGPLAESRLLGRYPRAGTRGVWSDGDWLAATREMQGLAPLPIPLYAIPEIGCDVARFGDDFTAIHTRCGPCSIAHESANGWDTVTTAKRLMVLARHWALWYNTRAGKLPKASRPESITEFDIPIKIDDDGVGGGVKDILEDAGYAVVAISAANVSIASSDYPNRRSELWFVVAERARNDELDFSRLPDDVLSELRRQAMAPEWSMDARARRVVESKDTTKDKIDRSPDDMDAVNLAYSEYSYDCGEPIVIATRSRHTPQSAARPGPGGLGMEDAPFSMHGAFTGKPGNGTGNGTGKVRPSRLPRH